MPYILLKSNGKVLTTVDDGSVDRTTSLTFVGKNYAGYGQLINQDLVYLLENFASSTSPTNPIQGQAWFDNVNQKFNVYNGSNFRPISFTEVSTTEPVVSKTGDYWFNSSNNQLYIKSGDSFIRIGATSAGGSGDSTTTGLVLTTVNDTLNNSHLVLRNLLNGSVVSVFSFDSFEVNTSDSLYSSFPYINRGITVVDANSSGRSATAIAGGGLFFGTAATSLKSDCLASADSTSTFYQASTGTTANTVAARDSTGSLYANNFYGNASNANRLAVGVVYSTATSAATPLTVVSRDASGNVLANQFIGSLAGIATTATFANNSAYSATSGYANTFQTGTNITWFGVHSFINTSSPTINNGSNIQYRVGFRDIPQTLPNTTNYTTILSDAGAHIQFSTSTISTCTIASSLSVAYNTGTVITFVNMGSAAVNIKTASPDTLYLGGIGTTGTRTLSLYSVATAMKVSSNSWLISGAGLT